jgi:hypothetical protein
MSDEIHAGRVILKAGGMNGIILVLHPRAADGQSNVNAQRHRNWPTQTFDLSRKGH